MSLFDPAEPINIGANPAGTGGIPSVGNDPDNFVATSREQSRISGSDSAWMDNLLKIVGVGASAYATVQTAKANAQSNRPQSADGEAPAVSAPMIAQPRGSGSGLPEWVKPAAIAAAILGGVALVWGLMRRR